MRYAVLAHSGRAIAEDKAAIRANPRDPAVYRRLAGDLRGFADDLVAVGDPPAELSSRRDRIVKHMREAADLFDEAATALARGDIKTFQEKGDAALRAADKAAH